MFTIMREPDKIQIISNDQAFYLGTKDDVTVEFSSAGGAVSVDVTSGATPVSYVKCRWYGELPEGVRLLGDAIERGYGNLEFECLRPERVMPWYFVAAAGELRLGCGVKVRPDSFAFWQADSHGVTLWLDMRCGGSGLALRGRTVKAASLVELSEEGTGLFDFMREFCKLMSDSPLLPKEPVYGSNNWYYAYGVSSHKKILEDTELIATLADGLATRPFMVIDDGWQKKLVDGCEGTIGCLTNDRFPDMRALADGMREKGAKPGLWVRPSRWNPDFSVPELSLTRCAEYIDPSLDGALELVAEDMKKITGEWGYELVKYDYTTFDFFGRFHNRHELGLTEPGWSLRRPMTNAQALKRLYRTIRDNTNGAVIIGCNCVGHLGSGYFHLHRSGDDTSGNEWERTRLMGVNTLAFRLAQHKSFFEVDADCVGIRGKIDWRLNREWLKLLAASGTPLFVSADPEKMTPEILTDLREAMVAASEQKCVCRPEGLLDTTCPERWTIDGETREFKLIDAMGADKFGV